ncbi:heavy metal translocating P-type ATPase [Gammaproteobacteria bacterium AS21]
MTPFDVNDNQCFHCLLDVPNFADFKVTIEGKPRKMCCLGCVAVAEMILASGLDNYYKHRNIDDQKAGSLSRDRAAIIPDELALYNTDNIQQQFVTLNPDGIKEATLVIEGITCAACVWLLEKHLGKQQGIIKFSLNMTNHRARISWDNDKIQLSAILAQIHYIGYQGHPYRADVEEQLLAKEHKKAMRRLGIAGVGMMQVTTLAIALYFGHFSGIENSTEQWLRWISLIICTPILFYSAQPFFKAAIRDIKTLQLSMDVPVSIAIGGAFIASAWATITHQGEIYFDSVSMFTFFLLFGRFLEMQARHRTGRAGNALQNLLPEACTRLTTDENGKINEQLIPASELNVGDIILIKPGHTLPADGIIISGYSSIDESALTGEYLPKRRNCDDNVIAGTLNVENPIQVKVTSVGDQTQLSAIVRLLERASEGKPKVAILADKVASYFVACVLISAVIVSISWWYIDPSQAFWITLSVLVVTCPCALSLATPTALTTATGTLRQSGLLITRSHVLENLASATDFVFDKTGTLTQGNLSIEQTIATDSEQQALEIAAALEANSEHPIAKAFKHYLKESASDIEITLGQGIQGSVNGVIYRIGKPAFSSQILTTPLTKSALNPATNIDSPATSSAVNTDSPPDVGHWILLCNDQQVIAWFLITDSLRVDSVHCIQQLKSMGFNVHMLTGDSSSNVQEVAQQLAIEHISSGASPEDKINYINQLRHDNANVVMIGDGINDLPVLAGAQTSIAMGSASDLAKTHADAVLTSSELKVISDAVVLARKTKKIIKQNIFWAFSYNMLALPLAAFGLIPPYAAAIGMSLSSLIVVTNALRLAKSSTNTKSIAVKAAAHSSNQHVIN